MYSTCVFFKVKLNMSSSEEDMIDYYQYRRVRSAGKKNVPTGSRMGILTENLQSEKKFLALYRMRRNTYLKLLKMLKPHLEKKDTNMRESIPAEERILITLR